MFQNLLLSTAQEIHDSNRGLTPCIVMKDDEVMYHQVSSFSPELWAKVMLRGCAVVSSVCRQPWRYSVVHYYPSMSYATMNITFTAHCVGRTFFARGEPECFHSFHCVSSLVRMSEPRFHKSSPSLWYQSNKACAVCGNPECGEQFCDTLRLPVLTHGQSIGGQHPTGKQGVELWDCAVRRLS